MVTALAEMGRDRGDATQEQLDALQQVGIGLLERLLDSPAASPLVWYDEVYTEVAQEYLRKGDPHGGSPRVGSP